MSELSDWKRHVLPGLLKAEREAGRAEGALMAQTRAEKALQKLIGDPRERVTVSTTRGQSR